jgi:hypothetical protein
MFLHIDYVEYKSDYSLFLKFNDGTKGEIDLSKHLWGKVFEPLKDVSYFKTVKVDKELGTICWANDADFAPEFLKKHLVS